MGVAPVPSEDSASKPIHSPTDYERLLNPDKSLPKVKLDQLEKYQPNHFEEVEELYLIDNQGETFGSTRLEIHRFKEPFASLEPIHMMNPNLREKEDDLVKATYLEILKYLGGTRLKYETHSIMDNQSREVWDWLVEKGVARKTMDEGRIQKYEII